jgi:hypothetical protein
MRTRKQIRASGLLLCSFAVCAILPAVAQDAAETIIHSFRNYPHGSGPYGTLTRDAEGNFYGTTELGLVTWAFLLPAGLESATVSVHFQDGT